MSTTIEQFGNTSLVESGSNYFLYPIGGSAIELSYGGAPVVDGQFGQWVPIGAEQTASGYEVAWKMTGADQYTVWYTDSSGNYLSSAFDSASGTSAALESLEPSFQQDLNGDGVIGIPPPPSPTVIEQFGGTSLVESGSNYFLHPNGGSWIVLSYNGAPVVDGQFGQWVPIGAEQTASGYEVAWKMTGADQYTVWYTDNSGNYLSSAFDSASGTSPALESFEPSFHQDLNGDGFIGVPPPPPPQFVYESTDANGVQLYDVTWNILGEHPFAVRVLAPDHPSTNYAHSFLFALPVEGGLAQSTDGSGLDELRQLNVENQYNATIIEPIFPIDSWYADNPYDATIDFETFTATFLPKWVDSNLAMSGTENNFLIGFSKSGYGALDLLFKHPAVFDGAAAWDFPADMAAYDTFGSSSSGDYGSDTNFQANYRMTASFLNTWKAPFTTEDRIWISEGSIFPTQVADFDALLTSQGVLHTLSTTQTNDAHNWYGGWVSGAVAGLYGLVDTPPAKPAAPADSAVVNGYVNAANDTATQALTGTTENGSTVTIYDNGTRVGTTTAGASTAAWSFGIGTLADASTHSYTVTATDAAGNVSQPSAALNFTVDTTPPAKPAAPADSAVVNGYVNAANDTATQALTGTTENGSTVTVYDNGTQVGTTTASASTGAWSFGIGTLADASTHSYTVTATDAAGNVSQASSALSFVVDKVPPTVTITTAGGLTSQANQTISGSVKGTEAPVGTTVSLYDDGAAAPIATATVGVGGAWSTTVTLSSVSNSIVAKDTDAAGNTGISSPLNFTFDATPPTVKSFTASPSSGDVNAGTVVTFTMTMNEIVTVTGVPTLTLNDGGSATYKSGSGSNTLVFGYTVANAENTPALAVTGNNLNGSTINIADALGSAANLAGANVTFTGLAVGATVKSITASPATGDLGPGQKVVFTVTMSEAVEITLGTPYLSLNDGGKANYTGGSGTSVLTFSYTVGATGSGQNAASLAVTGFNPNGATVYDSNVAADTADLSGVIAFTPGPQVDTTAPLVASVVANPANADLDAGNTVTLTVNFSKTVIVNTAGGTPYLNLNDGGKANYVGGSGTSALTFTYLVSSGQNTPDLSVQSLALNGGTIADTVGNKAVLSGAAANPAGILQIDTSPPTISSVVANPATADLGAGKTVTLTVNFSEIVNVVGGTPFLTLSDGGTATYTSGTSSKALIFTYVVASGQNSADLTVTGLTLPGTTTIQDNAGNNAVLTGAVTNPAGTLQIDTTAPTVSAVTTSPGSGEVTTGHAVTISLAMSEKVTETGAPVLLLNDGGTATYKSGSGTSTLAFNYTVASGQVTSDLRVAGIVLSSPSAIQDLAGNAANLSAVGSGDTKLGINTPPGSASGPSGGNFTITGAAALELFNPSTESVSFASGATGELKLDASSQFNGQIAGFTGQNLLDLADIGFGANTTLGYTANSGNTGGTLTVSDGTHKANIALLGQYVAANFATSADGFGGTLIVNPPPTALASTLTQPQPS
jgi:hypothetical protein